MMISTIQGTESPDVFPHNCHECYLRLTRVVEQHLVRSAYHCSALNINTDLLSSPNSGFNSCSCSFMLISFSGYRSLVEGIKHL